MKNSVELYLLKDPDLIESIYQRILKVGTIRVKVDTHSGTERAGKILYLKNIKIVKKLEIYLKM